MALQAIETYSISINFVLWYFDELCYISGISIFLIVLLRK